MGKDGSVRMLYDPDKSRKGALCFVGRNVSKRRQADEAFYNPVIFNANTDEGMKEMRMAQSGNLKATRKEERKNAQKTKIPQQPSLAPAGTGGVSSQFMSSTEATLKQLS